MGEREFESLLLCCRRGGDGERRPRRTGDLRLLGGELRRGERLGARIGSLFRFGEGLLAGDELERELERRSDWLELRDEFFRFHIGLSLRALVLLLLDRLPFFSLEGERELAELPS